MASAPVRVGAGDPELRGAATELRVCSRCGTARTLGAPPEPESAHQTAYYAPTSRGVDRLLAPLRLLAERDRLGSLGPIGPGDRVLEVGSGDGRLLAALARRGAEVRGIEPSASSRLAAEAAGVDTFAGGVEQAEPGEGSWDVVIFWHALEHLDDPGTALEAARSWLVPAGRLVLAVPNRASLQARIAGERWFHQDVPRHRTHFTAAGARAIAERHGFEVRSIRHQVVEQNPLGMWLSLLNRLTGERDVAFRMLKGDRAALRRRRDVVITVLAGPPLALVAIVLESLATLARRGGTIVVRARSRGAPSG